MVEKKKAAGADTPHGSLVTSPGAADGSTDTGSTATPDVSQMATLLTIKGRLEKDGKYVQHFSKAFEMRDGEVWKVEALKPYLLRTPQSIFYGTSLAIFDFLSTYPHGRVDQCLIVGERGPNAKPEKNGGFLRRTRNPENFVDVPRTWLCLDVDNYEPFGDPVNEPEDAILDFIASVLPAEFHGHSFTWQLSASAGMAYYDLEKKTDKQTGEVTEAKRFTDNRLKLKVHLYFILDRPLDLATKKAWAKATSPMIDPALFNEVQPHFIAWPILGDGVADPITVRVGHYAGPKGDGVPIQIPEALVAEARQLTQDKDKPLVDMTQKPGVIGAFCRAFTNEDVVTDERLLGDHFDYTSGDPDHITWLGGSGAPDGVFLRDDHHIGANHGTWPFGQGRVVNQWDVCRVLRFGHLDPDGSTGDDLDELDAENTEVQHLPSHKAMLELALSLPEVQAELQSDQEQEARARQSALEDWRASIRAAADEYTVREKLCPAIRRDSKLDQAARESLAVEVNTKIGQLTGSKPGVAGIKRMLKPSKDEVIEKEQSGGLGDWMFVTDEDKFFRPSTGELVSYTGFGAKYDRDCPLGEDEKPIPATHLALNVLKIPVVTRRLYFPGKDELFSLDGLRCANTYRPSSEPVAAEKLGKVGREAVAVVERHVMALCGDREWLANHLLDWMAFCVQNPGKKIRHSPVIQGVEGDGKSVLGTFLATVMGGPNVRIISPEVIAKGDFNGWAEGACVGVLEELRLQGQNRFDILNSVKPLITNDTVCIHRKRIDPYNAPNVTNYLAFTNHKDALPLDDTDRRWLVIFAPWNSIAGFAAVVGEDSGSYFDRLHSQIENHGSYLRRWMLDRDVSAFKPSARAPETEEKRTMVDLGIPDEHRAARELIEAGGVGYGPEVVSTRMLSRALSNAGYDAPKTVQLEKMMLRLSYQKFPNFVKWDRESHRVWTKRLVTCPEAIRRLLDETKSKVADEEFSD